jgi:hypothetical protein
MMSLRILFSAVPMWTSPLAKGGPSCRTNFSARRRGRPGFFRKAGGFPFFQALRLARDQVGFHGKVGARQIQACLCIPIVQPPLNFALQL